MDVHEAILSKRAVRSFTEAPLPEDTLEAILNAGRRAQSSKNTQPWHFLVLRDRETLRALSEHGVYAGQLLEAAAVVAILTPDPSDRWSIMFDAGQAAGYMQLAAWELGVGSCPVTIHQYEPAAQLLGLPDDLHLRVVLSFGFPADPTALTAPPRAGGRRPLPEVTSFERIERS